MEKSEIEHYLRDIWVREFEKEEKLVIDEFNKGDIELLAKKEYVNIDDGFVNLTENGERLGRSLVRKHRIAEKVVADLFLADRVKRLKTIYAESWETLKTVLTTIQFLKGIVIMIWETSIQYL